MIRRRAGWWQVRVYAGFDPVTGRRQYRYAHTESEQEAQAVEVRLKVETRGVRIDPARGRTLGMLLSRWLVWVEEFQVVAPSTLVGYRHWAERVVVPALGRVPVARLDVPLLEDWLAAQRRAGGRRGGPLSPSSLRDLHAVLVSALDRAVAWGWYAANPARLVRLPPVEQPEVVPPSAWEVARLLAAAQAADALFGLFVRLAAVVGARRGELCALRWSDVDFPRSELVVARSVVAVPGRGVLVGPTKTRQRRRVALDCVTVDLLRTLRAGAQAAAERAGVRWHGGEYVFAPGPGSARPPRPDVLTRRFAQLRDRVGVPCRLHDLRHFMCTQLMVAGVDLVTVAGRAGHADARMVVEVYAHFQPARDQEAAALLAECCDQPEVGTARMAPTVVAGAWRARAGRVGPDARLAM